VNERIDLARIVTDWLAVDAPPRASQRVLAAAIARVAVTPQRRTVGEWLIGDRLRISPNARLALLGTLLMLGLLGGALVAAALLREPEPPRPTGTYEAVFARSEEVTGPARHFVYMAIDAEGRERELARLPQAVIRQDVAMYPPEAVMSRAGLLAVPASRDMGLNYRWEIIDLRSRRQCRLSSREMWG
jgi:hypothetical protein